MKKIFLLLFCVILVLAGAVGGIFVYRELSEHGDTIKLVLPFPFDIEKTISDALTNRWVYDNEDSYYYENGLPVKGWNEIEGEEYYFDDAGIMLTNVSVEPSQYVDDKGRLVDNSLVYSLGREGLNELKIKLSDEINGYAGEWSIYIKNLDINEYMEINNVPVQAASIAKLYNMATVYDEMKNGNIEEDESVEKLLFDMITVSDNMAYNRLLSVIGGKDGMRGGLLTIQACCEKYSYEDTVIGSTISSDECGISPVWIATNYTSVRDCGHLLEDIYRGNLVSEEASEEMLSLLKQQKSKGKIPAGLPEGVESANKTGEYGTRQHDAAIVFSEGADYIIVIMTDGDGASIHHIQTVSAMVYEYFNS